VPRVDVVEPGLEERHPGVGRHAVETAGRTRENAMSPYFVMPLGFLQRYRKAAGIGTLASYALPLAIAMTAVWTVRFLAWWALGIPLGPGAPVR
jgi:aminobenzoyl-glutamate transport protein